MDFASKLRLLRHTRGLSQIELADRCGGGIANNLISQMETGKLIPAGDWLDRIKAALDWPEDESVFDAFSALSGDNGNGHTSQEQPA